MADAKQPFPDFDIGKALAAFKIPGLDLEALMTTQRKNIEALTLANQLAAEAVQAVARRQMELATQSAEEAKALLRDLAQPGPPDEILAKNADLAKQAFEKALANARELGEILTKAQTDRFNVISKRITETFNEFSAVAKTKTPR